MPSKGCGDASASESAAPPSAIHLALNTSMPSKGCGDASATEPTVPSFCAVGTSDLDAHIMHLMLTSGKTQDELLDEALAEIDAEAKRAAAEAVQDERLANVQMSLAALNAEAAQDEYLARCCWRTA